jgi:hypothetical protein
VLVCALVAPAAAQPKKQPEPKPAPVESKGDKTDAKAEKPGDKNDKKKDAGGKAKNFDFTALDLNGRMRTPQLLYFLERANEELERASLEKRTFIPHIVRSVEEEQL